ncbi:MAG: cytochrome c3 family protein [Alphaproteobacteria bacterium]
MTKQFQKAFFALAALVTVAFPSVSGTLSGSKHDLTGLNTRAGVEAMTGLVFNDYRDPCIYCHVPSTVKGKTPSPSGGEIQDWNRYFSTDAEVYQSPTLRGKVKGLGAESLICLSCHDGSMAVDMVLTKPENWNSNDESSMHMKLDSGGGLDRCTQCHDGTTAHKMDAVVIGKNLMDDHPVGVEYPSTFGNVDFHPPSSGGKFQNGIKLFQGKVECATCHDVHNPDIVPFLRVERKSLCITCHNK